MTRLLSYFVFILTICLTMCGIPGQTSFAGLGTKWAVTHRFETLTSVLDNWREYDLPRPMSTYTYKDPLAETLEWLEQLKWTPRMSRHKIVYALLRDRSMLSAVRKDAGEILGPLLLDRELDADAPAREGLQHIGGAASISLYYRNWSHGLQQQLLKLLTTSSPLTKRQTRCYVFSNRKPIARAIGPLWRVYARSTISQDRRFEIALALGDHDHAVDLCSEVEHHRQRLGGVLLQARKARPSDLKLARDLLRLGYEEGLVDLFKFASEAPCSPRNTDDQLTEPNSEFFASEIRRYMEKSFRLLPDSALEYVLHVPSGKKEVSRLWGTEGGRELYQYESATDDYSDIRDCARAELKARGHTVITA